MKKLFSLLFWIFTISLLQAQPDGWQVNSSDFEYSMTITAAVEKEGTRLGAEGDYLGAFAGDECRGVAQAKWVESYEEYRFFLTVFSNSYSDEEITLKYYQAANDEVITGFYPLTFEADKNMGSASKPFLVSEEEPEEFRNVTFLVYAGSELLEGAEIVVDNTSFTTGTDGEATLLLADGSYAYTVTADGYATFNGAVTVDGNAVTEEVTLTTTGFHSVPEAPVAIYPNPARKNVTVAGKGLHSVELMNLQGRIVRKIAPTTDAISIRLQDIRAGLYLLRVVTADETIQTTKLLIR